MNAGQSLLRVGHPMRAAGAHNPMSARLVEQAGFDAIWASSFEIATSLGVSDADVLSWPELMAVARSMAAAVRIPVVADCEAGFGGADVVAEMAHAFDEAGIAAICMEDAAFPRRNSLLSGDHGLCCSCEFARKIEAAKRSCENTKVIARVQSLIARQGHDDAMARAKKYEQAGADAIVIHSRNTSPEEILRFVDAWTGTTPLVLIPTTYHQLSYDQATASGKVAMVIYANHGIRAAIGAMRRCFAQILDDRTAHEVEGWIAPLADAFALQSNPHTGA